MTENTGRILLSSIGMIIQRVIKGIGGLTDQDVDAIFEGGIPCNWWRTKGKLLQHLVPGKLTDSNLDRHRHAFKAPDPNEGGAPFYQNTPFISTTAGTMNREVANRTNTLTPAWRPALFFATNRWKTDAWLFYCHLFVIGRAATPMEAFSEEVRDMNIYPDFSPFLPEGEITAKLVIPAAQIERADFFPLADARNAWNNGRLPSAAKSRSNRNFVKPESYNNLRDCLM